METKFNTIFRQLLIIAVICVANVICRIKVDSSSRILIDDFGRKRIFHGVNHVYKEYPYYPPYQQFDPYNSLSEQDFINLRNWGFNFVRINLPWNGLETNRGEWNHTLLDQIDSIIQLAKKYDVYILLDGHQDILNGKLCGNGFPDWTIKLDGSFPWPISRTPYKTDSQGNIIDNQCAGGQWSFKYGAKDVFHNFQRLYDNDEGIADEYASMWAMVATKWKNQSNIIGYELINEPWFGDVFEDFRLFWNTDKQKLQPFYRRINDRIRSIDNDTIVFFEPCNGDLLISMDDTPGGKEYNDRQVFSYHIYCPFYQKRNWIENWFCKQFNDFFHYTRQSAAKSLNVGTFLTEFGEIGSSPSEIKTMDDIIKNIEHSFSNFAYWAFKYGEYTMYNNGLPVLPKIKVLSRSYFQAFCGQGLINDFDSATGKYQFAFIPEYCMEKDNQLYISEDFYYQNGFSIEIEGCNQYGIYKIMDKYLYGIKILPNCQGQKVMITVNQHNASSSQF